MKLVDILDLDEEEFDEHLVWVDHREDEESIIEGVAEVSGCDLSCVWIDDKLITKFNGKSIEFPFTNCSPNQYIAISSLAEMLKVDYEFWLLRDGFDGDTHGLFVVKKKELTNIALEKLKEKFDKLELGVDYFSGLDVPYLNNPNNNPNLMQQLEEMANEERIAIENVKSTPEVKEAIQLMKAEINSLKSKPTFNWKRTLLIGIAIFITLRLIRSIFNF